MIVTAPAARWRAIPPPQLHRAVAVRDGIS